jgi:hypothetical protein
LLETQAHVLEKFVTGMMVKKGTTVKVSNTNEEAQEEADKEPDEGKHCFGIHDCVGSSTGSLHAFCFNVFSYLDSINGYQILVNSTENLFFSMLIRQR